MTTGRSIRVVVGLLVFVTSTTVMNGCARSGSDDTATTAATTLDPTSTLYRFELQSVGDVDRHQLVAPVPVGRTVEASVGLRSQGELVEVGIVATVVRSAADGSGHEVELEIVAVEADDLDAVDGLRPIIGAESVLRLDRRWAVVEQVLDVPEGLAFRADAVARQVLRAPFALVGPLPVEAVGSGSSWRVRSTERGTTISDREVALVEIDAARYRLSFELPEGAVEMVGRPGALLPTSQVITLTDAELTVTSGQLG